MKTQESFENDTYVQSTYRVSTWILGILDSGYGFQAAPML